ncbi:hypothetical protein B0H14DRAFT_3427593 [Mycena olivaceomarginata]|nr:hypothetical protein B0H14DRAFT_3427593 [Mycena olivaceomarginata]
MTDHVPAVFAAIHPDRPHDGEIADDLEAEVARFLLDASKDVANEDKEYKRLMQKCLKSLKENKLIKENDAFFSNTPDKLVPFCICDWIMHE